MKTITAVLTSLFCATVCAESQIPKPDYIVAKASTHFKQTLPLNDIKKLVLGSQLVGQTEINQGVLKTQLAEMYSVTPNEDVGYLYARVLQKEHLFDQSLEVINQVLTNNPNHVNARLLKANMLQVKGKFDAAKSECLRLLGLASVETVSTCTLDAESQNGKLESSYKSLLSITKGKATSQATQHVLAEMAFRLNQPSQTIKHLSQINLNEAPVSILVLWSDAQLELSEYSEITQTIGNLVSEANNLEDALLLRLAQAEKQDAKNNAKRWQNILSKRIDLRERRQDSFHAADLALYYLTVENNSDKALYWATINWQQAKLDSDKRLLSRATAKFKELENEAL